MVSPDTFAAMLCDDMELPRKPLASLVASSIRAQLEQFGSVAGLAAPLDADDARFPIHVEILNGALSYNDRFEWDMSERTTTDPEGFARTVCSDLGIGGRYTIIDDVCVCV